MSASPMLQKKCIQLFSKGKVYYGLNLVGDKCGDQGIMSTHNNIIDFLYLEKSIILQKCTYLHNLAVSSGNDANVALVASTIKDTLALIS